MSHFQPRIGISVSIFHRDHSRGVYNGRPLLYLEQSMVSWLMAAGVRPYVVPFAPAQAEVDVELHDLVAGLDGLVLQGGVDVAPQSYGEEPLEAEWSGDAVRDAYELALIEACLELDKPLLAICRGHQLLNVALGGTLYQDIGTQVPGALQHTDSELYNKNIHQVRLLPGTRLAALYDNVETGLVNSVHHQAVKDVGKGLVVEARSEADGVVEAIRLDTTERYAVGLQWHPEFQDADDHALLGRFAVLEEFLGEVAKRST